MDKVSVIIPARNEPYLQETINDIFTKSAEDIEIIVMLDGYWPQPSLKTHNNLTIVHTGAPNGMRANTNAAARIATGKYLLKCDAHCMFGKSFDRILKFDCEPDWLVIPSRYSMDAEKWERTRGPIDYLYLTYPYTTDPLYGAGFHGKKWIGKNMGEKEYYKKENENKHILIDDIMAFQGSCWFMHREQFFKIDGLDTENYRNGMHQESVELLFKFWLSGGRVIRNKKTWYAHWHKTKDKSGNYALSKKAKYESNDYTADFWMNDRWPKRTRDIKWFVSKFWPIPGWPENWEKLRDEKGKK